MNGASAALSHDDGYSAWLRHNVRAGRVGRSYFKSRGLSRQRVATNNFAQNAVSHNSVEPLQCPSPSLPEQYGADTMDRASPTVARKAANARDEVRSGLHLALTRKIPTYRNPAKEVADLVDTSEGTVRSLRQANIPEAMVTLVMLGRAFPDFRSEVARLMGLERDLDPDFQRDLSALLRRVL